MNKVFSLLLIIPGLLLLILYFAGYSILEADYNEFEEYRLEKINNYAVDAALQEMTYGDDLEQDYIDVNKVIVYPNTARDTFLSMLALSYNLPITQENLRALSAQYLDLFIVAAYDGYYVYTNDGIQVPDMPEDYSSYTGIKHPYSYTDSSGNSYALDMRNEIAYQLTETGVRGLGKGFPGTSVPLQNRSQVLTIINSQLNREINKRLYELADNNQSGTLMLPTEATTVGSVNNNIESISVLAFVNDINFTTTKSLNAFSIGGAKLKPTRQVACYSIGGKKYYCYVDLIDAHEHFDKGIVGNDPHTWADYLVNTFDQAAALGYSCDVDRLTRR